MNEKINELFDSVRRYSTSEEFKELFGAVDMGIVFPYKPCRELPRFSSPPYLCDGSGKSHDAGRWHGVTVVRRFESSLPLPFPDSGMYGDGLTAVPFLYSPLS